MQHNLLDMQNLPKTPVPSDIEVSQQIVSEVGLLPIVDVAAEAGGIGSKEYDAIMQQQ